MIGEKNFSKNTPNKKESDKIPTWLDLSNVDSLDLTNADPTATALNLSHNQISTANLDTLLNSKKFSALKHLKLAWCGLEPKDIKMLADSKLLGQLESLDLSGNHINAEEIKTLLHSNKIASLKSLNLHATTPNSETAFVSKLANAPALNRLEELIIELSEDNYLENVRNLLKSPHLQNLKNLTIYSYDDVTEKDVMLINEFPNRKATYIQDIPHTISFLR